MRDANFDLQPSRIWVTPSLRKVSSLFLKGHQPLRNSPFRRALNSCSWFGASHLACESIANFAITAAPLTGLLKKEAQFKLGQSQECAFQSPKHKLTEYRVLSLFNGAGTTEAHRKSRQAELGVVHVQRDPDSAEHVAYASLKISDAEPDFHYNELKYRAVVWSVNDKFRRYPLSSQFTVVTVNVVISWTISKQHLKH